MTKLSPVNNHLLIEPLKDEKFMASTVDTYQEIGVVVAVPKEWMVSEIMSRAQFGDRVYFDSWLAKKFPKEGTTDEFYWLVKWDDVSLVEHVEPIPEQ